MDGEISKLIRVFGFLTSLPDANICLGYSQF